MGLEKVVELNLDLFPLLKITKKGKYLGKLKVSVSFIPRRQLSHVSSLLWLPFCRPGDMVVRMCAVMTIPRGWC